LTPTLGSIKNKEMIKNIIKSWKHIPYTLKHYIAFLKLEKKLLGYYKYKFHDLDKVLMYLFIPFIGTHRIKMIHRKINRHHITFYKTNCNYEEAIIDWECSRFTKADKPRTAREIVNDRPDKNSRHYYELVRQLNKFNL